jgi:ABC-type molybdenum transport system ATPase subunit/photorepair protein PhrA
MAGRATGEPLIRVRHADLYRAETLVLRDVCWELERGGHTAIRGENGSGKSTLAMFLAGTLAAANGADVVRFGQRGPFNVWELKRRVALVSDDLQIAYDRAETVEAVIASGFPASIGLFVEPSAEQRAAVAACIERLGLQPLRGRPLTQLSFGERRKVLIARSLVRTPELLILDETWNGLDSAFRAALIALLGDMTARGTTLVTIAHDDDEAVAALVTRTCTIAAGHLSS